MLALTTQYMQYQIQMKFLWRSKFIVITFHNHIYFVNQQLLCFLNFFHAFLLTYPSRFMVYLCIFCPLRQNRFVTPTPKLCTKILPFYLFQRNFTTKMTNYSNIYPIKKNFFFEKFTDFFCWMRNNIIV